MEDLIKAVGDITEQYIEDQLKYADEVICAWANDTTSGLKWWRKQCLAKAHAMIAKYAKAP